MGYRWNRHYISRSICKLEDSNLDVNTGSKEKVGPSQLKDPYALQKNELLNNDKID
jgi:hypothetical protein